MSMLYCVRRLASASRSLLRADSSEDVDELDEVLERAMPSASENADGDADDDELDAPQRRCRRASCTRGSDAATKPALSLETSRVGNDNRCRGIVA